MASGEGRHVQSQTEDVTVKVKAGWSRDQGCPTSDFIIADRGDPNGHQHLVLNDRGELVFNEYRPNH